VDEASSKYVDQIATQRLINDKLKNVHHSPDYSLAAINTSFRDFKHLSLKPVDVIETPREKYTEISFRSSIETRYQENNWVKGRCFCAKESVGELVFVHGLYEDNMEIYKFFISMLNEQGMNVHLMVLPHHYERTPKESAFSGEYFWSADVYRSALAFKQAVYDLAQFYSYIKNKTGRPVWIVGFSMGGGIGLSLVSLIPVDGIFVINPVCNITELMWHSALFSTIKLDLEANGLTFEYIKNMYSLYEPLNIKDIKISKEKVVMAKGLYDQINDPQNYDLFNQQWGLKHELSYNAGHLNILRVPKLAADITNFYFDRLPTLSKVENL
jgi:esterase/lipase